ncbi:thioesterase [Mesorhizobium sp. Root102]|uniref:thioesterase family protein n=1 Tax=Mesorhizobium sp. Root102 TaxID=1736422 RepID=UPI0006FFD21C|nr:thioesterase family protein [Mesorhizobium sp. Root102]KQU89632.1 thioesterase [Mesorhizobium sp. Root102]
MSIPSPFISDPIHIQSEWCDADGRLTLAHYGVVFDRGAEGAFELMGMGSAYTELRRLSYYTAEAHVCFIRPLHTGDQVLVNLQIIDCDDKRIRSYQEIHHVEGWLAATTEILSLHVDLNGPKVVPFPQDVKEKLDAMTAVHATLPVPERAGRNIDLAYSNQL